MTGKRILLLVLALNLALLFAYVYSGPGDAIAEDNPQAPTEAAASPPPAGDQWEALRTREAELGLREAELARLETRIDERIKQLEELRVSIQQELEAYRVENNARIRHLVKIYSSMKPKAAAELMNNMDLTVAVEVFLNMKGEIAGGILSYMDTQKAATITKRLAQYRRLPPATATTP